MANILRPGLGAEVSYAADGGGWGPSRFDTLTRDVGEEVDMALTRLKTMPTPEFLGQLEDRIKQYYVDVPGKTRLNEEGYVSRECWRDLCAGGIMMAFVPEEFGGRPSNQEEIEAVLAMCARYDLQLSLMLGISGSLVVQIMQRFGTEEAFQAAHKKTCIEAMLTGSLGALAVTENGISGSAIMSDMRTTFTSQGAETEPEAMSYILKTEPNHPKWWQGNSLGDIMIVIARDSESRKQFAAFLVDQRADNGEVKAERLASEGLDSIRYAKNHIDAELGADRFLGTINSSQFAELFTRSRLQFIGMTHGVQQALATKNSGNQVLQAMHGASQGLYHYTCNTISPDMESVAHLGLQGNCVKALGSEWAYRGALLAYDQHQSDENLQLVNDAFPFTRFEGPNQMLYDEIGSGFIGKTKTEDQYKTLLEQHDLTKEGFKKLPDMLKTQLISGWPDTGRMTREHKARLGKAFALVFALGQVDETDTDTKAWLLSEIGKVVNNANTQTILDTNTVAIDPESVADNLGDDTPVNKLTRAISAYGAQHELGPQTLNRKALALDEIREAVLLASALEAAADKLPEALWARLESEVLYQLRLLQRDHWASNGYQVGEGPNGQDQLTMPSDAELYIGDQVDGGFNTTADRLSLYADWIEVLENPAQITAVNKRLSNVQLEDSL